MRTWFQRLPRRLKRELEAARAANLTLRFERYGDRLVGWRGKVEVDGSDHFLSVVYTPDFPSRPPLVYATEAFDDRVIDDTTTFHQMMDGSLCLFALGDGPDAWSTDLTIVDVVERYREFRRIALANGHVDDHGRPLPDFVGVPQLRPLVLTPTQAHILGTPPGWGWVYGHALPTLAAMIAKRVTASDETIHADQDIQPWRAAPSGVRFPWVSVAAERWQTTYPNAESIDAILPEVVRGALGTDRMVLLVRGKSKPLDARLTWQIQTSNSSILTSAPVEVLDLQDSLFSRVDGAMPGRESLGRWQVVMVGLGSLGGTVALHLARTGVSRFALFDPDVLRPDNVIRHSVGIGGLFLAKTEAVRLAILGRNPWATVVAHPSSPLWDGTPQASLAFETLLGEPKTLVIVTTADHQVERAINDLAVQHDRPVLFASVLGHADHGRVFRVLPGETPCYQCVVDGQLAVPGRFFRQVDERGTAEPALAGYRQPGIPGIGIDVDLVAAHTARFALQTLSRLNGGSPAYPDAPGHHLVWTNRGGPEFDGPLQARWEPYERREGCPVCGTASEAPWEESDDRALRALEREMADPHRMAPEVPILGDHSANLNQSPGE